MWPFKKKVDEPEAASAPWETASAEGSKPVEYMRIYAPDKSHTGTTELAWGGLLARGILFSEISQIVERTLWGKSVTWKLGMHNGHVVFYFVDCPGKLLNDIWYRVAWYIDYWGKL